MCAMSWICIGYLCHLFLVLSTGSASMEARNTLELTVGQGQSLKCPKDTWCNNTSGFETQDIEDFNIIIFIFIIVDNFFLD